MASPVAASAVREVLDRISNYVRTVHALHAFVSLTIWQEGDLLPDTHYGLGRHMDTSAENQLAPMTTVTPDAVIQRSSSLGYVAEAKASVPSDRQLWLQDVLQLRKYDDDLVGWWTSDELVGHADLAVLVGAPRCEAFAQYVRESAARDNWSFRRPPCFIEFSVDMQTVPYMYLRREEGTLTDPDVERKLRERQMVPLEGLVVTFSSPKFYDSEPPTEYLMQTLWQHVFTPMKAQVDYDEALRCWPLQVTLQPLCSELQSAFGSSAAEPRQVAYPQEAWVRRALDALTRIGLATHHGDGTYTILFRRIAGDVVQRFARDLAGEAQHQAQAQATVTQLPLPGA